VSREGGGTEPVVIREVSEWSTSLRPISIKVVLRGDTLCLCIGAREWNLRDPGLSLAFDPLVSTVTSRFIVMRQGSLEASVTYLHPIRSLFARIDPTHDRLDFHMEHPLAALAEYATQPSWQARVVLPTERHAG
jgi:hypothetical protein